MKSTHSVTALFLTPLLELREGVSLDPFDSTYYLGSYLGDVHNEKYNDWESGKYVLLEFLTSLPEELRKHFQSKPSFVEQYSPQSGKEMFVFELPKEVAETYTAKVVLGKYSEAAKPVVDKYFPNTPGHPKYGNRMVFDRSDVWRKKWEERIGASLPDGAEVHPRPRPSTELYGYVKPNGY